MRRNIGAVHLAMPSFVMRETCQRMIVIPDLIGNPASEKISGFPLSTSLR
jgi:hypothetical protein